MIANETIKLASRAALLLALPITSACVAQNTDDSPFAFESASVLQQAIPDSATVVWATNRNALSWVEYGENEQFDRKAIESEHGLQMALQTVHRIALTGLEAGKEYTYRVCSKEIRRYQPYQADFGETLTGPPRTFRAPSSADKTVSFAIFNDIHNSLRLWKMLGETANAKPYDMLVLNGDVLADPPSHQAAIGCLLKPAGELLGGRIPLVFVRGNHETRGEWARRLPEYVTLPGGNYYYAFTRGPVRFVTLDGGEDKPDGNKEYFGLVDFDAYLAEEASWLEREIRSPEFQAAAFRVIFMHIPRPVEAPSAAGDPRGRFAALLQEGRADLLISGHTHTQEIVEADPDRRDYPIFIGGGNDPETATVIRVDASDAALDVTVLRANGETIATRTFARKGL